MSHGDGPEVKMHPGIQLACSMWALTAFSLTLIILRLYTRVKIVKFVGAEDYMYACTGVSAFRLICFVAISNHKMAGIPPQFHGLHPSRRRAWTGPEFLDIKRIQSIRCHLLDICCKHFCHYRKCDGEVINGPLPATSGPSEMA